MTRAVAVWRGAELTGAPYPDTVAVSGGTLTAGEETLTIEREDPADFRAVRGQGPGKGHFRLTKEGWTVMRYRADCEGRRYTAHRAGGPLSASRDIRCAAHDASVGELVATTRPRADGSLEVSYEGELTLDVVFITWALTYVDTPSRRTLT